MDTGAKKGLSVSIKILSNGKNLKVFCSSTEFLKVIIPLAEKKLLKFKYLPDPWCLLRDGYPDVTSVHRAVATSIFHSVGVRVAAIAVCVVSLLAGAAIFKLCFVHFICPLEWRLVFSIKFLG